MPRANAPTTRSLDEITIAQLRRLLHAGLDESLTVGAALTALHESDQASAAHELDVRQHTAYADRREARRAAALAEAAARADEGARGQGSGAEMAARQAARLDALEAFEQREPELGLEQWRVAGKPDVHTVGVIRRAVKAVTSELAH